MTRGAWREAAGWTAALTVAVIVVGQVASTARSGLLFRDGDSVVVALAARSVLEGQSWDWAMSSVLFLPELGAFIALRMLLPGVAVTTVLAVGAVVNLLALYGAVRVAAGRRRPGRMPVVRSVLALAAFGLLAVTETSASRDALEPASLLLTTTYYSATVIGAVLAAGLVRRWADRPRPLSLATLAMVALVCTLSNPIFLAWAVAPLAAVLLASSHRSLLGRRSLLPLFALLGGTAIGFGARIPFSEWIANSGAGYAQPALWAESAGYYAELAGVRFSTPGGLAAGVFSALLLVVAIRHSIQRSAEPGGRVLAAFAWFAPVAVVAGAIVLGTHAARYLQPLAFASVLAIVAHPVRLRLPAARLRAVVAAASALLLLGAGLSLPRIAAAAGQPDADARCVADWVDSSGRTGAGQFWTVRLPKLLLEDPARLVQVDHTLRGYAWLVNRTDFDAGEVTFLLEDEQTSPWDVAGLPEPERVIVCGRYRILDFPSHPLPLGPARS
ncbi:hypothetical protein ACFWHT_00525 [Microbacterium sp. NPDC058342]|uniref:hypothetical protein n=1 Tax=Microbacterium sp. NPDC058342 TaxID=3346454 RepID=UPI00364BA71C